MRKDEEQGEIDLTELEAVKLRPQVKGKLEYHPTPNQAPTKLLEAIDEITFRCFDQGVYWGKLAYSENERPDQPDNPIDRTEANKLLAQLYAQWLESLMEDIESFPHYWRSLFREGYPGVTEADYRDMLDAAQVKTALSAEIKRLKG